MTKEERTAIALDEQSQLRTKVGNVGLARLQSDDASTDAFKLTYFAPPADLEKYILTLFDVQWDLPIVDDRHAGATGQLQIVVRGCGLAGVISSFASGFEPRENERAREGGRLASFPVATSFTKLVIDQSATIFPFLCRAQSGMTWPCNPWFPFLSRRRINITNCHQSFKSPFNHGSVAVEKNIHVPRRFRPLEPGKKETHPGDGMGNKKTRPRGTYIIHE